MPSMFARLSFDPRKDLAPVSLVGYGQVALFAHPSLPVRSVKELIALAKRKPGALNYGSSGVGGFGHICGELFTLLTKTKMTHVPYKSSAPALTDLLAGQVQVMFPVPSSSIEYIRQGTLRPLAVTSAARWEALPDIPTMSEFVPGYEASTWFGIGAPGHTPATIVARLNSEINAGLTDPKMRAKLDNLGGGVFASSPAEFGKLIADETDKWAKVVKFAGLKPA